MKRDTRIDKIFDERKTGDGVWFLLKKGFSCDGVHAVHEETLSKCRSRMKDVKPCKCKDCL